MLSKAAAESRTARDTPKMRINSMLYRDIPQNEFQNIHIILELIHDGGYRFHHQGNDIMERHLLEEQPNFTQYLTSPHRNNTVLQAVALLD